MERLDADAFASLDRILSQLQASAQSAQSNAMLQVERYSAAHYRDYLLQHILLLMAVTNDYLIFATPYSPLPAYHFLLTTHYSLLTAHN